MVGMTMLIAFLVAVILFIYKLYSKKKNKISHFDEEGRLTTEGQLIIQRIIRENDSI